MKLFQRSLLTGKISSMDIPLDEKEFNERMLRYQRGELVQRAFPDLSPELREFILTGIAPEEWDEMANEEDE